MNESTDRPIILFYEGPEHDESLPVIFNLNADFRGILYAPNSPVVINGNDHKLQGFVVAESFVQLSEDGTGFQEIDNYSEYKCDTHDIFHNNPMYIDEFGEVQYKKIIGGSYETVDNLNFALTALNLSESKFDSFNLIWLEYYNVSNSPYMTDNLFTTATAEMMT